MILDEVAENYFEQIGVSHYNFTSNTMELMDEFWMDYYYNYQFGSDIIVSVANTKLY